MKQQLGQHFWKGAIYGVIFGAAIVILVWILS